MAETLPPLPPPPPRPPPRPQRPWDPRAIPRQPSPTGDPEGYVRWVLCRAREALEDAGEEVGFMAWLPRDRPDTRGLEVYYK